MQDAAQRTKTSKQALDDAAAQWNEISAVASWALYPSGEVSGGVHVIRSIGIKRADATVIMADIAYNLGRWQWLEGRAAPA
ncbi:hypothetical protein SH611_15095 [Geminicoccaceae bacterium 1502E]|nr:hypothetical protein [Geminicoccaceae bacterium 1502E]